MASAAKQRKIRTIAKEAAAPRPPTWHDELVGVQENGLEIAIGQSVREIRRQLDLTVTELGKLAGISPGMLSKIENGATSASLATLQSLSKALNVPMTSFFRKYEETREASFVPAGSGETIERRGSRAGHEYRLLGHLRRKSLHVEPYLITLTEKSENFPIFQHPGIEFLYMLEGEVDYRHGKRLYSLRPGDSLMFDSDAPHGPEVLRSLPAKYISIVFHVPDQPGG
ncbi:helix-turn-helix domain-containing protein [Limobrevibacterium gyesilva]|uniref:Helix-turn-helix domain-containing protein n=1 Tax=Limobrevibacterium gyesilva TaxID=2991712 RepID=A0AA42CFE4_9PROT|nr:helix-turn-helix domain-containing protein [Limobrevibacterium gyesilva]MCW3477093.1 helix-turn-helix domain-containing protein [Limobrevibacterium gyesilva]